MEGGEKASFFLIPMIQEKIKGWDIYVHVVGVLLNAFLSVSRFVGFAGKITTLHSVKQEFRESLLN